MMPRTALITGASSGIGRALALRLGRANVELLLCARREDELARVADEVRGAGGRARVDAMDVSDTERTVKRIRELDVEVGGIDLVVANAGAPPAKDAGDSYAWETMRDALHTNFCGAAATLTAILPEMVRRERGHLVAVSSISAYGALPRSESYCSPKAGLSMLLDCLRIDVADKGVCVTEVRFGFVKTPMLEESAHPVPLVLEPEQAAERLYAAIERRASRASFPASLAAAAWAAGSLPLPVHQAVGRALRRVR